MTTILIAVDGDEGRAEAQAEAVANLEWADDAIDVRVFYVFTENPEGATAGQIGSVRAARDVLHAAGIDATIEEASGDPAERILERGEDVELICVSGRKRSPTGKALFGSVSQQVLLGSDAPVLFVTDE